VQNRHNPIDRHNPVAHVSWLVLIDTGRTQIIVVRDTLEKRHLLQLPLNYFSRIYLRYNFHGLHGHTDLSTRDNTDAKLSDPSALSHESHQPARDFIFLASPG